MNGLCPQYSILGVLPWNNYYKNLLHIFSEACDYIDVCILTFSCDSDAHLSVITHINQTLQTLTGNAGKLTRRPPTPHKKAVATVSLALIPNNPKPCAVGEENVAASVFLHHVSEDVNNTMTFTKAPRVIARKSMGRLSYVGYFPQLRSDFLMNVKNPSVNPLDSPIRQAPPQLQALQQRNDVA